MKPGSVAPAAIAPDRAAARVMPALIFALAIGAVLRLTWNSDMEFKGDEQWMFNQATHVGRDLPWPTLGMPSGVGLRNAGMSVWVFVALAQLLQATTPLQLDHAVVLVNVLALALLGLFIWRVVPAGQREVWAWGAALAAVNPLGVLLQRKIWAQSIFPTFCVLFLWAWWRRDRWWGALLWGLWGGLLGQIHMSGFFWAAAFFLCTLIADRLGGPERTPTRWRYWFAGSLLAALALKSWLLYLASGQDHSPPWSWEEVRSLSFFGLAFSDVLGLGLDYSLGNRYFDFLRYPVGYSSLFPAMYMQGVSFTCGAAIFLFAMRALWQRRLEWRKAATWPFRATPTVLATFAGIVVFGIALTLSGAHVYRHYLHITYPFEGLALALIAFRYAPHPRRWLFAIWVAQLGLTGTFLDYIHTNGGAVGGDYGRAYRGN